MKATLITGIEYGSKFKPAKHTVAKHWDSEDTEILILLVLLSFGIGYFGYGILS